MSEPMKYRCSVCGKEEPWGEGWQWYGTGDDDCDFERRLVLTACSDACAKGFA